jgi:hypothetical protein
MPTRRQRQAVANTQRRVLYHYTSASWHWPQILAAGYLKTVDSNVSMREEHAAPDVVWFTDQPDLQTSHPGWADGTPVDKTEVRITVELDDAVPWVEFARSYGADPTWIAALDAASAGDHKGHWWVVPRRVWAGEWAEVRIRPTAKVGSQLGNHPTGSIHITAGAPVDHRVLAAPKPAKRKKEKQ